jgi:hypothetical protein
MFELNEEQKIIANKYILFSKPSPDIFTLYSIVEELKDIRVDTLTRLHLLMLPGNTGECTADFIKLLNEHGLLRVFWKDLWSLSYIRQNKGRLRVVNALDHTLMAARFSKGAKQIIYALYHDIGKSFDIRGREHGNWSARMIYTDMIHAGVPYKEAMSAYIIVKNHMMPHSIQRRNGFITHKHVSDFVGMVGSKQDAIDTVDLAIADKRATHDIKSYLEPYEKIKEMITGENSSIDKCLCPTCCEENGRIIEMSKSCDCFWCKTCEAMFKVNDDGQLIPTNRIKIAVKEVTIEL